MRVNPHHSSVARSEINLPNGVALSNSLQLVIKVVDHPGESERFNFKKFYCSSMNRTNLLAIALDISKKRIFLV